MKKLIFALFIVMITVSCSRKEEYVDMTVHSYTHSPIEMDMLDKINHFRDSIGVDTLRLVPHVSFKCYEHNLYMIDNDVINHDYFYDRCTNIQRVCQAKRVGEILAYNFTTNNSALHAWLNSPCHDTVVKGEFNRVGISITIDPENNRKYYTVIFLD